MRYSLSHFHKLKQVGEKIVMLTCYDASFAQISEAAGVEILLVGDSLGMVVQGHDSTLPVSMRAMAYHVACVARGSQQALVLADMPFGSYQESPEQALRNAAQLMAAGAQMVKLEGGHVMLHTIEFLVKRGIPVCGHVGLTPQSVNQLGGYKVQGKTADSARLVLEDAFSVEKAGASVVVLEAMPAILGKDWHLVCPYCGQVELAAARGHILGDLLANCVLRQGDKVDLDPELLFKVQRGQVLHVDHLGVPPNILRICMMFCVLEAKGSRR